MILTAIGRSSSSAPRRVAWMLAACLGVAGVAHAQKPPQQFPLIKDAGGVWPLPQAAEQPAKGAKVLFDVTAGNVKEALVRPARLLNLYALAGIKPGPDLRVAVVFHGDATAAVLADGARGKHQLAANDAAPLLRELKAAGVEFLVCGQSLLDHGFTPAEVAPEVQTALSALNVTINKSLAGYTTILIP